MAHLVCIGHLNIEDTLYLDRPPVQQAAGGAALYSAVAARIWGIEVSILSRVGENYPVSYLERLKSGGVNTQSILHIPGATMAGQTSYDLSGNRKYSMYAPPQRRLELTPAPKDWEALESKAVDGVHLATMPPQIQQEWIDFLHDKVPFISLDTDISFIRSDKAKVMAILNGVDVFFPNQEEAQAFAPGSLLSEIASQLLETGLNVVVIKCGGAGVRIYQKGKKSPLAVPAAPGRVLDVTGAGDAFAGGFVAGCLMNKDLVSAARMGTISASLAIEDYGGLHVLEKASTIHFKSERNH